MKTLWDIESFEGMKTLVDAFYHKVNRETLRAPIFNPTAKVDWASHPPQLYRFWESMLSKNSISQGLPLPKDAALPVEQTHFERWLMLFVETADESFYRPRSKQAKRRAVCIADNFAHRIGVLNDPAALAQIQSP